MLFKPGTLWGTQTGAIQPQGTPSRPVAGVLCVDLVGRTKLHQATRRHVDTDRLRGRGGRVLLDRDQGEFVARVDRPRRDGRLLFADDAAARSFDDPHAKWKTRMALFGIAEGVAIPARGHQSKGRLKAKTAGRIDVLNEIGDLLG